METRERIQLRIAQEAARLMIEEGVEDHQRAKVKAAERLGLQGGRRLPRNEAVDAARLEFQRIYCARSQPERISALRATALGIMITLQTYRPRLVGDLVDGSAGPHSPITLQVFPDTAEDVIKTLLDRHIPFRETSHIANLEIDGQASLPAISFLSGESRVDVLIFPSDLIGRTRARKHDHGLQADLTQVRQLIEADTASPPEGQPGLQATP